MVLMGGSRLCHGVNCYLSYIRYIDISEVEAMRTASMGGLAAFFLQGITRKTQTRIVMKTGSARTGFHSLTRSNGEFLAGCSFGTSDSLRVFTIIVIPYAVQ